MDNDNIKFNSIEEAKEFLSTGDLSSLGAVSFMDSNGESISLTFEQFVQMLGIDKVAELSNIPRTIIVEYIEMKSYKINNKDDEILYVSK